MTPQSMTGYNVQRDVEEHHGVGLSELALRSELVVAFPDAAYIFGPVRYEGTLNWVDTRCKWVSFLFSSTRQSRTRTRLFKEPVDLILSITCELFWTT